MSGPRSPSLQERSARLRWWTAAAVLVGAASLGAVAFAHWTRTGAGPDAPTVAVCVSRDWYDAVRLNPAPYAAALARSGANVVAVNPGDPLAGVDGLVLIGGGHVSPDSPEIELVREADRRGLPMLGICRGSQVLAAAYGGTLRALDPEGARLHGVSLKSLAAHPVRILPGTRLHAVLGDVPGLVSSTHVQAIDHPGRLRVAALSPDGVIEAVELPGDRLVLGIQWHPELESQDLPFRALVRAARSARK